MHHLLFINWLHYQSLTLPCYRCDIHLYYHSMCFPKVNPPVRNVSLDHIVGTQHPGDTTAPI